MLQIFAVDEDGNREEITDLYWFEENGVHDFGGEGFYGGKHTFEIFVNGMQVYPPVNAA